MPSDYTPEDLISREKIQELLGRALPDVKVSDVSRIGRGSTNLVYLVTTDAEPLVVKIAHRPDRIEGKVLEKEAQILQKFAATPFEVPIPKLIFQGELDGMPVVVESVLSGQRIEDLIASGVALEDAGRMLGRFTAMLHQTTHHEVDEFELGRDAFPNFPSYARYWLEQWREAVDQAHFIPKDERELAYARVHDYLDYFTEQRWAYLHGDISKENLLGEVRDGALHLTGLCDFENIQTGPVEYDFATIYNGIFLFYPELESPFLRGYQEVAALPEHFHERMITINLFRALRYIKRSVKYNETHYFAHDLEYLRQWLHKTV